MTFECSTQPLSANATAIPRIKYFIVINKMILLLVASKCTSARSLIGKRRVQLEEIVGESDLPHLFIPEGSLRSISKKSKTNSEQSEESPIARLAPCDF